MNRLRAARRDSGETLIEILTSVVVLGLAGVAIMTALTLTVRLSDSHRKIANDSAVLHNYAETLQASYQACTAGNSQPYSLAAKPGFSAPVIEISYWTGTAFTTPTCPASGDPGVQRITLTVTSTDSRAKESITVVVRKP